MDMAETHKASHRHLSTQKRLQIALDYERGMTYRDIQQKHGVGLETITRAARAVGLPPRAPGPAKGSPPKGGSRKGNPAFIARIVLTDAQRRLLETIAENPGQSGADYVTPTRTYADLDVLNEKRLIVWRQPAPGQIREVQITGRGETVLGPAWHHGEAGHASGRIHKGNPADATDFRNHASTAQGGPITKRRIPAEELAQPVSIPPGLPSLPKPTIVKVEEPLKIAITPAAWPIMDELLSRQTKNDAAARSLMAAAEALPPGDPLRESLQDRARRMRDTEFSPVEAEYLRYVRTTR